MRSVALVVLSLLIASGCLDRRGQSAAVPELSLAPAPSLAIGDVAGVEPYLFQSIVDARFLEDGKIVVADRGALVIRVFGPDGRFLAEMGGAGSGPGELRYINGLWIVSPDTVGVYDSENLRFTTFLSDGSRVATHTLALPDTIGRAPDLFVGRFRNGDLAAAWTEAGPRDPGRAVPDSETIGRFTRDGRFLSVVSVVPGLRRIDRRPSPMSPFPYAAIYDSLLYSTDGMDGTITVRTGDGVQVAAFPTPTTRMDPATAWKTLEEELIGKGDMAMLDMYGTADPSDPVPELGGMLLDDRGRIWVKEFHPRYDALPLGGGRRAWGGHWWILDDSGTALARIRIPDDVAPLQVSEDRLLGISIDEFDVERVVTHLIVAR